MSYKFWLWLARRLPRPLRYWTFVHVSTNAILPNEEVPGVTLDKLMSRITP